MTKVEKKVTNYVVVVDYEEGQTLSDCWLLGWNNNYDWFDCDTCGDDIITPSGQIKKNEYGLIEIDRWTSVYVGTEIKDCKEYSDSGNKEGYDCTVCRLEKTEDGWNLIPV
jgi:hypothetical protein